jgi:hypothetical protein
LVFFERLEKNEELAYAGRRRAILAVVHALMNLKQVGSVKNPPAQAAAMLPGIL